FAGSDPDVVLMMSPGMIVGGALVISMNDAMRYNSSDIAHAPAPDSQVARPLRHRAGGIRGVPPRHSHAVRRDSDAALGRRPRGCRRHRSPQSRNLRRADGFA